MAGKEIRTYRECNYEIVVPFFKVGLVDFGMTAVLFMISFFSFFLLRFINVLFAEIVMFSGMAVAFLFFMYARKVYNETGRVNVINEWLDYASEPEVMEGRANEEE